MKRSVRRIAAVLIGLGLGAAAGLGAVATAGRSPSGTLPGPPALYDPSVPSMPRATGAGEQLLLVVGGTYPTEGAANDANRAAQRAFGDLQGYYVVPVDAYLGLREAVGGDWALVSAFRTRNGAEEFAAMARSFGAAARVVGPVVGLGGPYAGLGQEEDPTGTGALLHPLTRAEQSALR